ncbi:MAG TPA: hypothetical protein DEP66_04820, partial [Acidimicrobiaceae bacterium]|nr:hypothetical protein [Acidimicrobiaceae bacterium]
DAPAGLTRAGRLAVNRHHVDTGRMPNWPEMERAVHPAPASVDPETERAYFEAQGPVSSALAETLAASDADLALHKPYLFWTTAALASGRTIPTAIWPAAHDEPALRLPAVGAALASADGLVFGSDAARRLTEQIHPVAHKRQIVLGVGVEPHAGDAETAARAVGIDDGRPWVLCVGRMEPGKGTDTLARLWAGYVAVHKPKHRLVLVGDRNIEIRSDDDLTVVGPVDEETKWGLLRGADVLVHPGRLESFGIVLVEAWAARTPVLVNARCAPTSDQVRLSGGGATFSDPTSFELALDRMLNDPGLRHAMAADGEAHWQRNYTWDRVCGRFMDFCERVVRFAPRART